MSRDGCKVAGFAMLLGPVLLLAHLAGCGNDARAPAVNDSWNGTASHGSRSADLSAQETPEADQPPSGGRQHTAEEAPQAVETPEKAAVADAAQGWPLFRGNPQATGVAPSPLPQSLELLWTFSTEDESFETAVAIEADTVYAASLDGSLLAIDLATGRQRWRFFSKLGFAAPPAVHGGGVYVGDADGRFYCLDAADGQPKWHFDTEAEIDSGANFYEGRVLVGSQDGHLYCLAADNGKLVWKYETGDQIRSFPTVAEGHAFVAGCDGRLHIVDLAQGKAVRFAELDGPTGCTAAVVGSMAFVGTEGGAFYGIDWQKAETIWTYQNPRRSTSFRSSAAATPQQVIVGARDKLVHALDPATGNELWAFTTQGQVDSSPVVVGDRVFIGSNDGRIYGLDAGTGKETWRFEAGGRIAASPAVDAGRLVIGTDAGDLYCFGK